MFLTQFKTTVFAVVFCVSLSGTVTPTSWAARIDSPHNNTYKIGVLAYKGKDTAARHWQAHASYLNQRLAPLNFEIIPLGYKHNELTQAVIDHRVDFVITNPGHYIELELGGYVTRLATRRMSSPEGILDQFGGTAITHPEHAEINNYSDLHGKKILIPSRSSLGGWQMHLREALAQGVNLEKKAEITELKNHKKVVLAILERQGDVGFVRSDLIEQLVAEGVLQLDQIKIINQNHVPGYPYLLSTRLYPEWPFATTTGTSIEVAAKVMQALLEITHNDKAAKEAGIYGWTIPGHYSKVNDLFRETELGPYSARKLTIQTIFEQYWQQLLMLVTFISAILLYSTVRAVRANRLLQQEIHERKKIEKNLKLAANVFEYAHEGIIITDSNQKIIDVNSGFCRITGYTRAEAIGKTPSLVKSDRQSAEFYKTLWQSLSQHGIWKGEIWNKKKNGDLYVELLTISTVYDKNGNVEQYVGMFSDITEYKKSEEALRRSQKMDAIGKLTGGIAHDFNNILGIILGNLEILKLTITNTSKSLERIEIISDAGYRAANLTKQLLSFARGQTTEKSITNINQIIVKMDTLISRSMTPEVQITTHLADNLWLTEIDAGNFEDSLLNLVINARDAMGNHGNLTIDTHNATLDAAYCEQNPDVKPGEYVELTIADTGNGISEEAQEHIFEPFFTTKELGKGTGLGLAMVFGFVNRSGGHIKCYSKEGVGSSFHLYLPRYKDASIQNTQDTQNISKKEQPAQGTETILVVDDEPDLLEITKVSLDSLGYNTLVASDGEQALKVLTENPNIDLVFSDVVMPGHISGYELADLVTKNYPKIKIFLTSGYTGIILTDDSHEQFNKNLLQKPYTQLELSKQIRKMLDV